MKSNFFRMILIAAVWIALPAVMVALPPDPPGGGEPPCGGPFGAVCPIDGGLSFLIAAGLAVGGKKAYDLSRKKQG
jgi:hypothetical protein